MDDALLARYAKLIVDLGANVQPGQDVLVIAAPEASRFVRALAVRAYERGARFVDPWYFDPYVKRIRAERAPADSLELVPPWYGSRLTRLGEGHGVRISVTPPTPPGLMNGIDAERAGRDQLPAVPENMKVINARTVNWCVVPWATPEWARAVFPGVSDDEALERLWEKLTYVLRLDADDPEGAWLERFAEIHAAARRLDDLDLDAVRFEGPGTDLTVGLLPSSRFSREGGGTTTVDGVVHHTNVPTEEVFTTPDPQRTHGVVSATKPLEVGGSTVTGIRVRFEQGRAVEVDAAEGAAALRARVARDDGASRLGEVALVDRRGRIGRTGTVFFNTLLDENAASHIALGNGYLSPVGAEDADRVNTSAIHLDFMIGSDDVAVTGQTRDGREVPVLRGGDWQF